MADQVLGEIRDAMSKEVGEGRDVETALALADGYVADNPDLFSSLAELSLEDCVKAVDVFRAAGLEDDRLRVEAWILHHFEFQTIGGPVEAKVRIVS